MRRFPKIPNPPYAPRPHCSRVSIKINDQLWSCNVLEEVSIAFAKKMIEERAERIKMLKADKENLEWEMNLVSYYSYYPDMLCVPPINQDLNEKLDTDTSAP